MVYSWAGTILRIDLTTGKVWKTPSADYTRNFLGARGTNVKLMYDEAKPGQTAFNPETPIIIGAGALAGTGALGCSKTEVTTRYAEEEPPTLLGNVGMGGSFAPELKFAGYDNIVIKGRAKKPVYIYVENDDVELKDAGGVWGKGIFETNRIIREEVKDPDVRILAIGQAGEKLVKCATIEHEYRSGSAMGAPFGAKNLKAVAVRGTKGVKVHDPETILKINENQLELMKAQIEREIKTTGAKVPNIGVESINSWFKQMDIGVIGFYEYHEKEDWPEIEKIKAAEWLNEHLLARAGCRGCPTACMTICKTDAGVSLFRCYPFWWMWKVWISDLNPIFETTKLCADYGLENGSVSTMVAWLMYADNEGIITAKDTDGIPMDRGNAKSLIEITHKIANREGIGDILADGPLAFSKKLGGERGQKAERLLMQRRGLVPRTVDMRTGVHYALEEAVASRGNSHRAGYPPLVWRPMSLDPEKAKEIYERAKKTYGSEKAVIPWEYEGKAKFVIDAENHHAIIDSLFFCAQIPTSTPEEANAAVGLPILHPVELGWLNAATGLKFEENDLLIIAERILNIERAFNVREGITRKSDQAPERWFTDPIPTGYHKGRKLDREKFEKMKDEYYAFRGWDVETGIPTQEKLDKLNLKDVADDLNKLGKIPKPKKT